MIERNRPLTSGSTTHAGRWLSDLLQDSRYALRQMRRAPGITALIVATLAIGIGTGATLAGVVRDLLLRPPAHVTDPDRVSRLVLVSHLPNGESVALGAANFPRLLDVQRELTSIEAAAGEARRYMSVGLGADATIANTELVTADYFRVMGVTPAVGRLFGNTGQASGTSQVDRPVAVLDFSFWQRRFGGDPGAIGSALLIGTKRYTIVGVLPAGFTGGNVEAPDLWIPFAIAAEDPSVGIELSDRLRYSLAIVVRLRRGANRSIAEQQAATIWARDRRHVSLTGELSRLVAAPLVSTRGPGAPPEVRITLWLAGLSCVVLLITCANITNLLLARAFVRRRETAVRLALGASRGRLARQILTEGTLLALLSGAAGLVVAAFGARLAEWTLPVGGAGALIDFRICALVVLIALSAGFLVSVVPVMQVLRGGRVGEIAAAASATRSASRFRNGLLVAQSALCMLLVVIAGLFALSFKRVTALDLGLEPSHTIRALVKLDELPLSQEDAKAIYDAMLSRVDAIPGVVSASVAYSDPYQAGRAVSVYTDQHGPGYDWPGSENRVTMEAPVGPGFFKTVGATLLRGRDFTRQDDRTAPLVAIINAPLAKMLFANDDPIGQCIFLPVVSTQKTGHCVTVVGVLSGVWYHSITDREKPMVYVPVDQATGFFGQVRPRGVFIRVLGDPSKAMDPIRRALQGVRSDLPAARISLMRDEVAAQTRPWRLGAIAFGVFGVVALIVAIVGLYGIVSFTSAQRSFEIAVRLAVGARWRNIVSVVALAALTYVAIGIVMGAAVAIAARKWLGPLLFQTSPDDPRFIVAIAGLLLSVGAIAVLPPIIRALRIDPAVTLRAG